jgi:hypothetical protein
MFGKKRLIGLVALAAACLCAPAFPGFFRPSVRSEPETFEEVIAIAEELGLYYRSDRKDGLVLARLIVSERALTWEQANGVTINTRTMTACRGTVAVYRHWDLEICTANRMVPWGSMYIYGDPALIEKLLDATR